MITNDLQNTLNIHTEVIPCYVLVKHMVYIYKPQVWNIECVAKGMWNTEYIENIQDTNDRHSEVFSYLHFYLQLGTLFKQPKTKSAEEIYKTVNKSFSSFLLSWFLPFLVSFFRSFIKIYFRISEWKWWNWKKLCSWNWDLRNYKTYLRYLDNTRKHLVQLCKKERTTIVWWSNSSKNLRPCFFLKKSPIIKYK